MPEPLHVERHGPVTVVTIDRPDRRNAVDRPTADALLTAFESFDADPSASVAVLTGADGTFCAGADLQAIASGTGNTLLAVMLRRMLGDFLPVQQERKDTNK